MINNLILFPNLLALLFFIYFLWKSRGDKKHFVFLSLYNFLFVIILTTIFLITNYNELENTPAIVDFISLVFYVAILALPPTFYFYTISLTDVGSEKLKDYLVLKHYLIPLLLLFINLFSFFYLKNYDNESTFLFKVTENVMNYANFIAILFIFPILSIFYIFLAINKYRKHKLAIAEVFSYEKGINLKWMFYYILGYCVFIFFIFITQGYIDYQLIVLPISIFLFFYLLFIGALGITQKQIKLRTELTSINKNKDIAFVLNSTKKEALKKQIFEIMENEPYLNKSLTLQDFTKLIGSNSKYISYLLNTEFEQNFSTFINSYRVNKAKTLLVSDTYKKYTIESISELVGFQSKSAFNKAFKRQEGQTPSNYKTIYFKNN